MTKKTPEEFMSIKEIFFLSAIFIVGLLIRFFYINDIAFRSPYFSVTNAQMDPLFYYQAAVQIASGDILYGNSVFAFMPLYSYFLAIFVKIFSSDFLVITRFIQAFLGALSCVLLYFAGRGVFNKTVGVITAIFSCFYSMFIFYDAIIMPSALSIFLSMVCLVTLLFSIGKFSSVKVFFIGLLAGVNAITTGAGVLLALLVGVWLFRSVRSKKIFLTTIFYVGVLVVVMIPMIRNYTVAHDFVPITSHSGINFFIGNNENADGKFKLGIAGGSGPRGVIEYSKQYPQIGVDVRQMKDSEISKYWFSKGILFIVSHPLKYAKLVLLKICHFFFYFEIPDVEDYYVSNQFSWILLLPLVGFGIIAPFALMGMVILFGKIKNNPKISLLFVFFLAFFASCIIYFVNSRYRLLAVPYMLLFSGYSIWWFLDNMVKREFKKNLAFVSCGLFLFSVINIPAGYDFSISYYNLGTSYLNASEYGKAVVEFKKSILLKPDLAKAHLNLGVAYFKMGRFDIAIKELNVARGLLPSLIEPYYNLVGIYTELGNTQKAELMIYEILKINPKDQKALLELSEINFKKENYSKSSDIAKELFEFDPKNPKVLWILARLAKQNQDIIGCKDYCNKIMEITNNPQDSYYIQASKMNKSIEGTK